VEETLKRGLSQRGGQSLLRSALEHYAAARLEPEARRKAQRTLLANGQVGLHEQIRLQPFIAGATDAPIRDALYDVLAEAGEGLPHGLRGKVHALMSRLLHPSRTWRSDTGRSSRRGS
jgi:hypothetical protein